MSECIFCRIVAGDAPSETVLETEHTVAFRDLNPAAPVHVLVVPRDHIESWAELNAGHAELLVALVEAVQQVADREGVAADGYRVVSNVGRHGGMTVPHLHLHVLGGRPLRWPPE